MISGLGVDSVEVDRIRKAAKRWGKAFLRRLFTDREIDYCFSHANPYPSLAARFAEMERDLIMERTQAGLARARAEGIKDAHLRPPRRTGSPSVPLWPKARP